MRWSRLSRGGWTRSWFAEEGAGHEDALIAILSDERMPPALEAAITLDPVRLLSAAPGACAMVARDSECRVLIEGGIIRPVSRWGRLPAAKPGRCGG